MRLRIDKSNIRKVSQQFRQTSSDIDKQINNIVNIVNDLSNVWQGVDYNVCRDIVNDKLIPNLKKSSSALDDLGYYLERTPATYDSVDSAFKSKTIVK